MSLFGLSLAAPTLLFGLLALPIIWWLLRLTPPRPQEEVFPPTRILAEIDKQEETPASSPWWLTLLRLLMAGLIILALAEPIFNARTDSVAGTGPALIVVDDSWSSGAQWEERVATARQYLDDFDEQARPVALVFTSAGGQADFATKTATTLQPVLAAANPKPVPPDHAGLMQAFEGTTVAFSTVVLLSSGLDEQGTAAFLTALNDRGPEQFLVVRPDISSTAILSQLENTPDALRAPLARAAAGASASGTVNAYDRQNRLIGQAPYAFAADDTSTTASFELPVELRNDIARVEVSGAAHAGAVQLLDERFRRRKVGLIAGGNADRDQPLLSPLYYISKALAPFSEVREADSANVSETVDRFLNERISTLVMADIGRIPTDTEEKLRNWLDKGGTLIRFAGPRLAAADDDTLVPVTLRRGGRSLGGTLTWGTPQKIVSFDADSPFSGITVPADVAVTRQVLAEPGIDLREKTWANLEDGTPLVSAASVGKGTIVLFHVTADASWSNLPLSGAFVDMLRRIIAVSNGSVATEQLRAQATATAGSQSGSETTPATSAGTPTVTLPPLRVLNGNGRLVGPDANVRPAEIGGGKTLSVSLPNPPGFYGSEDAFAALNLFGAGATLSPLTDAALPAGAVSLGYTPEEPFPLRGWLFAAALLLLALDCLAVLWMAGALRIPRNLRPQTNALIIAGAATLLAMIGASNAAAQSGDNPAIDFENTLKTRLAYVKTGDAALDELSRKGLAGLTRFISTRTSLEPGQPVGVDLATDELAFYPFIYWPISTSAALPTAQEMARIDAFMKRGGSVMFDTRDQLSGGFGSTRLSPETQRLRTILASLDIPPLEPVPDNHVLTRAFYLLNVFPGRYRDGNLWVETSQRDDGDEANRPARQGDGVSSILITANDMAAAWAEEADGTPTLPMVPPNPTQRVYAYRTGVNIIMYTLTGNYKSDQVHIPALLERLGQ
ncbi:MAG: DUF4159 domain-containing protein [Pseudomonadota bacterium]